MNQAVFLVALLSTVGIAAFTLVKIARLITGRRASLPTDVTERLDELEGAVQNLQSQLAETQERLDFTERLLSTAREQRRIDG